MRWYFMGICLLSSMTAQADLLENLKALGQAIQAQSIPSISQSAAVPTSSFSDEPVSGPGGIMASCSSIRSFNQSNREAFHVHFEDWTPEMLDFLKNTADRCAQQKISLLTPNNYDMKVMQINGNTDRQKSDLEGAYLIGIDTKKQQANSRQLQAQQLEIEQRQQQRSDCKAGKAFKLYESQELVMVHAHNIDLYKQLQAKDRSIAKESGVRDLETERQLGAYIVNEREQMNDAFNQYKQLGGTAKVPQLMTHQYQNSCG